MVNGQASSGFRSRWPKVAMARGSSERETSGSTVWGFPAELHVFRHADVTIEGCQKENIRDEHFAGSSIQLGFDTEKRY